MENTADFEELFKGLFGANDHEGQRSEEKKETCSPFDAIDPGMLLGMLDILGELSAEDDAARLMFSLRPFFSPARAARVEEAVRMMKLAKAAEAAMKMIRNKEAET